MLKDYFDQKKIHPAPLATFRILFGCLMLVALIRFWVNGWIYSLYIEPDFHFKYYGFEWVDDLGQFTYVLYVIAIVACLGIILGYHYKFSVMVFFVLFTYTELIDKTTYLNHYYFTSCVAFILCFLPAGDCFSLDARRKGIEVNSIPKWTVDSLKFFLAIVYFYAGIAKINSDWLVQAQPLSLWLSSKYHLPLIGGLLQEKWVHYVASWSGMLYDVFIPFFLWNHKTRRIAFFFVVLFHIMTKIFFPSIGMFPYIMLFAATIFFKVKWHKNLLVKLKMLLHKASGFFQNNIDDRKPPLSLTAFSPKGYVLPLLLCFFAVQILFPFRYLVYPGELFWNEEGYRFSWRVMLMEKKGYTTFKVKDGLSQKTFYINNADFLTPFQERQMSFQPDFILEYAHHLANHFTQQGYQNVQVFADSFVALNGRPSQRFIDPKVDLAKEKESFNHKIWVLPFADEIQGL